MRVKIRPSKWKGAHYQRMAYLLSFSPDEAPLFEAFWIGYKTMDTPRFGAETKSSIQIERELKERSIEGGSIKLAHCPGCGQRVLQYGNLRTLEDGQGLDLILEKDDFDYIKSCFGRWERTFDEMREPFNILHDRFEDMKSKPISEWQRFLEERTKAKAAAAD